MKAYIKVNKTFICGDVVAIRYKRIYPFDSIKIYLIKAGNQYYEKTDFDECYFVD